MKSSGSSLDKHQPLESPTGIHGLEQITEGSLSRGRPTQVYGDTGSGKTLLAMAFLVRDATEFNEPGVFMAFEEAARDLIQNVVHDEQVIAVQTLIKSLPLPLRRIIGDMLNIARVLVGLDIRKKA